MGAILRTSPDSRDPIYSALFSRLAQRAENRKCLPSGRKRTKRCEFSPRDSSSFVTWRDLPPESEIRYKGERFSGAYRTSPVELQAAEPSNAGKDVMVRGLPPSLVTFFSFCCA